MSDDAEVWSRVERAIGSVYISELYWLARGVAESCEVIFEAAPAPPGPHESYLTVNHGLQRSIYQVLSDAARIKALLTDRPRRRGQSALAHKIQEHRTAWLRALLSGLVLDEVLNARVRNSLEHFDEYLDASGIAGVHGEIPTPALLPLDIVLGRDGTLNAFEVGGVVPTVHELRTYHATERVFVNAGQDVSLGSLHQECETIRDRMKPLIPDEATGDERGSYMPVVTQW